MCLPCSPFGVPTFFWDLESASIQLCLYVPEMKWHNVSSPSFWGPNFSPKSALNLPRISINSAQIHPKFCPSSAPNQPKFALNQHFFPQNGTAQCVPPYSGLTPFFGVSPFLESFVHLGHPEGDTSTPNSRFCSNLPQICSFFPKMGQLGTPPLFIWGVPVFWGVPPFWGVLGGGIFFY